MIATVDPGQERTVFLSTLPAPRQQCLCALLIALASLCIFLLCAPFAQVKLTEVWAFMPSYQGVYLAMDLITATLLFAQFAILAEPSLLLLASGYMFTGLISIPHALSFPRLFGPAGLIGGGAQTTAWLYMIWHAGFPLAVIGYSLLHGSRRSRHPRILLAGAIAVVVALVVGAGLLTTAGHHLLPTLMRGDRYTPVLPIVTDTVCAIIALALLVLLQRRPYSVLDVWLMVVMSAPVSIRALHVPGRVAGVVKDLDAPMPTLRKAPPGTMGIVSSGIRRRHSRCNGSARSRRLA